MTKWEYKLHKLASPHLAAPINTRTIKATEAGAEDKTEGVVDDLNAFGDEGWEIIFVWPDSTHILMKREKASEPEAAKTEK